MEIAQDAGFEMSIGGTPSDPKAVAQWVVQMGFDISRTSLETELTESNVPTPAEVAAINQYSNPWHREQMILGAAADNGFDLESGGSPKDPTAVAEWARQLGFDLSGTTLN